MTLKSFFERLNLASQCKKYNLSLWQCPQFLFLLMGLIIIVTSIFTFALGNRYLKDPHAVALAVFIITAILFVISFIITKNFENLAEVSRMKSEFIHIVTHQLRSPLTNLRWGIDFLMAGGAKDSKEKELEYFQILRENTGRMGELVDNLLIVSKIEQGNLPENKKEVNLCGLISTMLKGSEPFAKASNTEIIFNPPTPPITSFLDAERLKLVFENLINNAIRYSKGRGKIEVVVLEKKKMPKSNFVFEIKDNGLGIPEEEKKYIFQKFFRAKNVSEHQTQGSGLGLYISKMIIEKMKGKIGFKSVEGKGSTFWFTIPVEKTPRRAS